ncbi:uncharacterized protein [Anabrus simplex]|uniref:uncharacterized protein n=1 Tax=Anabrus simplex TaxID=316456 RepID=UPI0035A31E9F
MKHKYGNYKLTPEITNSKEEFKSELMELGITQENGEITPEMIYLKEEFKSELTELGQRQENYELVPEITHFNEEFKSELIEPGQTQPSAEVKEEEHTACQLVSCVKEENINWYHNGEHVTLPAPDTGGARAMVETLGLHRGGQLSSSELETLTSIQAEHKGYATTVGEEGSLQDEDLGAGEDSLSPEGTIESVVKMSSRRHGWGETSSPEAILPDIMDETTQEMDICDIAMSPPSPEQDLTFKLSSSPSHHQQSYPYNRLNSQTTSSVPTRVSTCGGQKTSGFSSNVAVSSVPQFQSLETTGGNIVQLQPSGISKQGVATNSSNMAVSSVPQFQSLETTGGNIVQLQPSGISKQGVATSSSNMAVSSVPHFQSLETTGGNIVQHRPSGISKQGVATSSSNMAVSSVPHFQSLETTGGNIVQHRPSGISKQGVATSSSNMAVSSVPHFQSLETTGGNIVQHRPSGISKQGVATNSSNFTPGPCQGIKPLLATIKHPATSGSGQMRNVYTITGNQHNQQSTPLMLATSLSGNTSITGKPTKIISSGQRTILASQTKVITLAQAQKLGLISPTKLQQIMSASSNKQSIPVNKLVSSESTITMMPASTMVKSSTNILPVPVSGIAQSKPATVSVATVHGGTAAVTTVNTDVKPLASSQKVVISQGPGTLQGMKRLLATMKRLATSGSDQMRNAYTKVIITDNRHNQQGKPVILAKSQSGDTSTTDKPIKIISSTSGQGTLLASPMNAITLPQAQQLGLISPTNLQQIMPTSQNKQSVTVNKPVSSSSKNAIMRSSTMVKSLRKILPAPESPS